MARSSGRIASWRPEKGFGFICPEDGSQEVFVHIKAFKNRGREPVAGDGVSYTIALDKHTRLEARSVIYQDETRFSSSLSGIQAIATVFVLGYGAALAMLVHTARLPAYALVIVVLLNLVTYFQYWHDKRSSEQRWWRTKESTLHLLSLFGGWPGALLARERLRHKSSKTSFKIILYATVFLNMLALLLYAADILTISLIERLANVH